MSLVVHGMLSTLQVQYQLVTLSSIIGSGLADNVSATTDAKTVGTSSGQFEGDMFSIAFNVNDDLSISYSEMTSTHDTRGHVSTVAGSVAQEADVR